MRHIWVLNGKTLKYYALATVAALFAASFLYASQAYIPAFSTDEGPRAFHRAEIDEKKAALTFNISWGDKRALPILEILADHKVEEATFFVSASWAERHPDILEKINEAGYTIGNHGYQYEHYTEWEESEMMRDLNESHRKLKEVGGIEPVYFRPPHGDFDERVLQAVDRFGYSTIHWSVGGSDWKNPGVETIVKDITENTEPGDVILLHASDSAKQTHKALPVILNDLSEKGYQLVSLEELITDGEAKTQEIK
ncbi:polysaccharide deacetylase family sporulation protein PdaB [Thalassorhabdus alkalitolerans]|uniref:Polysaccharide deacetylase family sporulation protein PdaB n=1 Tax=Thalassorhabdus alkalitolerans TaxID=2282697 RepID=A0ABW0YTD9_9BACI